MKLKISYTVLVWSVSLPLPIITRGFLASVRILTAFSTSDGSAKDLGGAGHREIDLWKKLTSCKEMTLNQLKPHYPLSYSTREMTFDNTKQLEQNNVVANIGRDNTSTLVGIFLNIMNLLCIQLL